MRDDRNKFTVVGNLMSLHDFANMVSRMGYGINDGRNADELLAGECARNLGYTGKAPRRNYKITGERK